MAKMRSRFILTGALALVSCAHTQPLRAQTQDLWLQQIERQAIEDGVSPATVHDALDNFSPNPRVVELDQRQPETTITFAAYRRNIVTEARARKGAELMDRYASQLGEIERQTGVPPQITVALWGVESSFGANMGDFETVNSLATLAYEGRRADFFRAELIAALHILDQEHMSAGELRGSWAGAMGQCQFMPSTYLKYAVDADHTGHRDIWADPIDVMASIANYLAAEGWQSDLTWGREVEAGDNISSSDVGLGQTRSLAEWTKKGVTNIDGSPLPSRDLQASLLRPDGEDGPSFLVYDNIRALMRWNRSTYFALSVGLLADAIKQD